MFSVPITLSKSPKFVTPAQETDSLTVIPMLKAMSGGSSRIPIKSSDWQVVSLETSLDTTAMCVYV